MKLFQFYSVSRNFGEVVRLSPPAFVTSTFLVISLFLPITVNADVYKCVSKDGKITLTDRGCPADEYTEVIKEVPAVELTEREQKLNSLQEQLDTFDQEETAYLKEITDIKTSLMKHGVSRKLWEREIKYDLQQSGIKNPSEINGTKIISIEKEIARLEKSIEKNAKEEELQFANPSMTDFTIESVEEFKRTKNPVDLVLIEKEQEKK